MAATAHPAPDTLGPAHGLVDDLEASLDRETNVRVSRQAAPRDLLVKSSVDALMKTAAVDWAFIIVLWVAVALTPMWLYPLWALLLAGRIHALGVLLHDACHLPIREKTPRIRLLEAMIGYPIASTIDAMRYHHLRHHRDSGMDSDPYFKDGVKGNPLLFGLMWFRSILLVPFWIIRGFYGAVAAFVPAMQPSYARVFLQDRSGEDLRGSDEVATCAREEIGQALFFIGVFALLAWQPEAVLKGFLIPGEIAGILAGLRLLLEHNYERTQDRRIETILSTTCDHNLGVVGHVLLAPHHVGHHIVHHIHPQVGWQHLPKLRQWYVETYPELYPEPRRKLLP